LTYFEQKLAGTIHILDIQTLVMVFVSILVFGIVIISLATWLAVNRYLRMNTSDLYYV